MVRTIFFDINGVLIGSPFSFERSGRQFITGVLFSVGFPLLLTVVAYQFLGGFFLNRNVFSGLSGERWFYPESGGCCIT